jgi:antitoxin component YwqK of YwqJK toxin-antitoxin module
MRILLVIFLVALSLNMSSCIRRSRSQDYATVSSSTIVNETYIHKYGLTVPKEEWTSRGQDGRIVSTQKNGVVIQKSFSKGVLDGETTYTYPLRDIIEKVETYSAGKLVKVVFNDENGVPREMTEFLSPTSSEITVWYEDGAPQSKERFEGDRLIDGKYYTHSNQVEASIDNGKGKRVVRNKFGQIESVAEFQEGRVTLLTLLYPNGAPKEIVPYVDGMIEGDRKFFLVEGEPERIEHWEKGRQHGLTRIFKNGEKFADVIYRAGNKSGIEKRYRNGQQVVEEISWVANKLHGPSRYYVNGNEMVDWYWEGDRVTEPQFMIYNAIKGP